MYSAVLLSSNLPLWREDFRIVYAISDGKQKNKQEKLSEWRIKNFFHWLTRLLLVIVKKYIGKLNFNIVQYRSPFLSLFYLAHQTTHVKPIYHFV